MSEGEISVPRMPEEIVMDILSRLPVKSLLQFRCVSKQWRSIIDDGHFSKSHLSRSLLLSSHRRLLFPTSPLQSADFNASSSMANTLMELDCPFVSPNTLIKIVGACNGLACFLVDNRDLIIYNPSTRHSKALLPPQQFGSYNGIDCVYGFGCGSTSLHFKVVVLPRFARHSGIVPFVVFGHKDGSWRTRDMIPSFDFIDEMGTFLNGALHWLAYRNVGEARFVVYFNVSEEAFKEMCLPPPYKESSAYYCLGALEGCLYVLCDNLSFTHVDVWMMKEYGVEASWMKFIRVSRHMGFEYISYVVPLSFMKEEGEVLMEVDISDFLAYDTKKKTFRAVMVRGQYPRWSGDAVVYVESLVSPYVVE